MVRWTTIGILLLVAVPAAHANAAAVLVLPEGYSLAEWNGTAPGLVVGNRTDFGREVVLVESSSPGYVVIRATKAGEPDHVAAAVTTLADASDAVASLADDVAALTEGLDDVWRELTALNGSIEKASVNAEAAREAAQGVTFPSLDSLKTEVARLGVKADDHGDDLDELNAQAESQASDAATTFWLILAVLAVALYAPARDAVKAWQGRQAESPEPNQAPAVQAEAEPDKPAVKHVWPGQDGNLAAKGEQ